MILHGVRFAYVIDRELSSGVVWIVTQKLAVIASVVIGNIYDWLVLFDES